ncbi:MAG: response regulator [candidate division KSB1 bacterium]|nr:response regulator [candidate division KSB1 bacterium]MDZ7345488.1 response regulator [candidate division KSB1 bacterium]
MPKILIVDDEQVIRSGCRQILEMNGYQAEEAADGREGLRKLAAEEYDVVLTDILMPEMDGMQLLEEASKLGKDVVFIVITGYATLESAINAGRRGAFDYLPKPFNADELIAKVERALEHRNNLIELRRLREERDRNLLECSNERARTLTIINSMSEGVVAVNRKRQIVLINPAAAKLLRFDDKHVIGMLIEDTIQNPELREIICQSLENVAKTQSFKRLEFTTSWNRTLEAGITPISDEKGEAIGAVAVLSDVTEEKKIEKIKSDFVSYVAHELKAPLGAIEGYLNLIIEGITAGNPEKEREMILKSRDRARGLIALINDLLDLSRIDRKRALKEMGPVDLKDLLQETLDFYRLRAENKSLRLGFAAEADLPPIRGNREDLSRLFANLISNAIKYTPDGGEVKVDLRRTNDHVCVSVSDTGIGISEEAQKYIFDEFYRAPNALAKKITGTGLGLAIAKKIAEDHHGNIRVESRENAGSTFRVFLPVLDRYAAPLANSGHA